MPKPANSDVRGVLEAVDLPAPELTLEGPSGNQSLADYWKDRPAVLVFLRHFG